MGTARKPKFNRAATAHSRKSQSRRKPAPPRPTKLRTGSHAEAILKATRAAEPARAPDQPYISPTQAVREMRDGVPATELREIRRQLDFALSCVIVVRHALIEQNVELDHDAARILRLYVGDELDSQIERISQLLGDPQRKGMEEETP